MAKEFGSCWEMFGTPEKTSVDVLVGAIDGEESEKIGLTIMQMRNLGTDYGPCRIDSGEGLIPISIYDASLRHGFRDSRVAISEGLAKRLSLKVGRIFRVERIMDRAGKIRYECKTDKSNPFGHTREKLNQPVEAIVAAIDDNAADTQLPRVGLSSWQLRNLDFAGQTVGNAESIKRLLRRREQSLLDGIDYGDVLVSYRDAFQIANVYNASGSRGYDGPAIRVSSKLAAGLCLELGDKVLLEKTDIK